MKPLFTFLLLSVLLNAKSFAQKSDSLRLIHLNHLQKELSINSVKAQQVLAIQENAKSS